MQDTEKLKAEMLDYIKKYMLITGSYQSDVAKLYGTSQSFISRLLKGETALGSVFNVYIACGGHVSGIEESKEKLVDTFLNGESND